MGGLRFGKDGDGNYGYYGADDSLIPFKHEELDFDNAYTAYATSDSTLLKSFPAVIGQTYIVAITSLRETSTVPTVSGAEVLNQKHVKSRPYNNFYRDLTVIKLKATSTTVIVGSNLLQSWNVICAIPC